MDASVLFACHDEHTLTIITLESDELHTPIHVRVKVVSIEPFRQTTGLLPVSRYYHCLPSHKLLGLINQNTLSIMNAHKKTQENNR